MVQTLSEQMLDENRDVFDAMVRHRFVEDIKADRLPNDAFERYLVFEGAFVDTAIAIFSYATAKADTIEQKRWLIGVLDALANQQIAYFEKTFAARDIDPTRYDTAREDVAAFREGMLAIARDGGFLDTIAAMFAAEWMYWTWSTEANRTVISDPLLKEWVGLHAEPDFEAQARWLKAVLDEAGSSMVATERKRLSAIFGRAQRLEIDFHEAAYS
ncbi:TenA family protein [Rhizobium sp. NPDC090279]|uniref:TenA family protein n=1 Tax=Rhizobium sp. NPDC090279 TaxID=3364499 RepID=UPI00383B9AC8